MKETARALYEFWSRFGIPAYPEYSIPDDADLPYITYEVKRPIWSEMSSYTARVWYRDTSFVAITEKVDEIAQEIGDGVRVPMEDGNMWIFMEDEFVQMQPLEDDSQDIKVAYLSMIIHVIE